MAHLTTTPFPLAVASLDDVVHELTHLPSAPRVLPRLKQLLCDANSSLHDVVALIRLDPGIAARVLQIGNSAFYNLGLRCYTVDEAVHRIGYDRIYEIVANAVAAQVLVRPLESYALEADELWRNSIACAFAAELLASRGEHDRDVAYTIGLMHSVGMVALDGWCHRRHPTLRIASCGLPLETCETESALFGFHHGEAGAALLRSWEFPSVMSEPVRWQYLPRGTAAHFRYAALLHVAKWVRTAACRPDLAPPLPEPALLKAVGAGPAQLQDDAAEVRERLRSVHTLLETEGGDDPTTLRFPGGDRAILDTGIARSG